MTDIRVTEQKVINSDGQIVLDMASAYEVGNYGDLLSRYIVEKLSGRKVIKYSGNNIYHLCAIGSVLNRRQICSNALVWGSGFINPQNSRCKMLLTKFRQKLRGKAGKPLYLAVRGPKSRDILLQNGYQCPAIYGDPALIMPVLYPKNTSKKYKLGIVLHFVHDKFANVFSGLKSCKVIDINRKYEEINNFVDELTSCDMILSSSLHGLIIANAYGIPSVRLKITGKPIATSEYKDDFKFEDYIAGLNSLKVSKTDPDYVLNTVFISPDARLDQNFINDVKEKTTKPEFKFDLTPLIEVFPFLDTKYKNKKYII